MPPANPAADGRPWRCVCHNAMAKGKPQQGTSRAKSKLQWQAALLLLEGQTFPDVFACKNVAQTLAQSNRWRESIVLLEQMSQQNLQIDVVTATRITKSCGQARKWEGAVWIFNLLQHQRAADVVLRGAAVSACAAGGVWIAAVNLLGAMQGLDVVACSSAITACERGQHWEGALALLKDMQDEAVQPNVITYNAAMGACEKGGSWQSAFDLFSEMEESKIPPSAVSYSALISACRRASDWERALCLLSRTEPNNIIYSCAMEALLVAERWQLALLLWSNFRKTGEEADAPLLSTAMSAWAQGGGWPHALLLLQELQKMSVADGMAYTNAIRACEATGSWEVALQLVEQMEASCSLGMSSNVSTSCLLSVVAQASAWQIALLLLDEKSGLSADVVACSAALHACGKAGQWPWALELLEQAEKNGIESTILCNAAITACDFSAQWQRALWLLWRMKQFGDPDAISFSAAISACEKQWEFALALLGEMRGHGLKPSTVAFSAALTALSPREWQRALVLLGEMKLQQLCPNDVTYTTVISVCGQAFCWEIASHLLLEMELNGFHPSAVAIGMALPAEACGAVWKHGALLENLAEKGLQDLKRHVLKSSCKSVVEPA